MKRIPLLLLLSIPPLFALSCSDDKAKGPTVMPRGDDDDSTPGAEEQQQLPEGFGAPCRSAFDCNAGLMCDAENIRCVQCLADADCQLGAICNEEKYCEFPLFPPDEQANDDDLSGDDLVVDDDATADDDVAVDDDATAACIPAGDNCMRNADCCDDCLCNFGVCVCPEEQPPDDDDITGAIDCSPGPACPNGDECPPGRYCDNGQCQNGHCICVGCGTNQSCNPDTGMCAVTDNTCVSDTDCPSGQFCNLSRVCEEEKGPCQTDADCVSDPDGQVCDFTTGECFQCNVDADCPTNRKCDTASRKCVDANTCAADADCAGNQAGLYCETVNARCVACLSDFHCGGDEVCNAFNTCEPYNSGSQNPPPLTCNPLPWDPALPGAENSPCRYEQDCQNPGVLGGLTCFEDFFTERSACRQICDLAGADNCCVAGRSCWPDSNSSSGSPYSVPGICEAN
jgi:hypothetical protein